MLGQLKSVGTVTVYDDNLMLRQVPVGVSGSADWESFNNFESQYDIESSPELDKVIEESTEVEFEIKAIIGRDNKGKSKRYIVEWTESCGGGVTIEPASGLHAHLIREY